LPDKYFDERKKERFEAVTLEDVKKAAVSVFSADKMAVSIVVPQEKK